MHEIDRCRNSKLRQTKKRKPRIDIVEFSFPKLLGFNFYGSEWKVWMSDQTKVLTKKDIVSHYKLGEVVDSNVVDTDWDFLI